MDKEYPKKPNITFRQKLVLKVTKSKNREAIAEQRIMNQINHPHILFSYGLVYPENFRRIDLKNLEKYLPKKPKKQMMSSVDKLMKKNKYGEREFPKFEKNRSPLLKNYGDVGGAFRLHKPEKIKMSVSPNPVRGKGRKRFNFSRTFKDFELDRKEGKEEGEKEAQVENDKDQGNVDNVKSKKKSKNLYQKSKTSKGQGNQKAKYQVKVKRNQRHKSKIKKTFQFQKPLDMDLSSIPNSLEIADQVKAFFFFPFFSTNF